VDDAKPRPASSLAGAGRLRVQQETDDGSPSPAPRHRVMAAPLLGPATTSLAAPKPGLRFLKDAVAFRIKAEFSRSANISPRAFCDQGPRRTVISSNGAGTRRRLGPGRLRADVSGQGPCAAGSASPPHGRIGRFRSMPSTWQTVSGWRETATARQFRSDVRAPARPPRNRRDGPVWLVALPLARHENSSGRSEDRSGRQNGRRTSQPASAPRECSPPRILTGVTV